MNATNENTNNDIVNENLNVSTSESIKNEEDCTGKIIFK
jgi:hypothetical protein